jgi:hypothetical protein
MANMLPACRKSSLAAEVFANGRVRCVLCVRVVRCVVRQTPCPPGTWSNATGLSAPCIQLCAAGYICIAGSTSPTPQPCGSPDVYCVQGVWEAAPVPSGFYSWGGLDNGTTRMGISPCPAPSSNGGVGVYCPSGLGSMLPCEAGYYGNASQLSVSTCSGPCAAGYFCPLGSSSPTMSACGSAVVYVGPSGAVEVKCLANQYDPTDSDRLSFVSTVVDSCLCNGRTLSPCPTPSFSMLPNRYCPAGSTAPIAVPDGYFSVPESDDAALRKDALQCPPGSFCSAGVRYLCPSGRLKE